MLQVGWLLLGTLTLVGALGARRSRGLHQLGLAALAALFLASGAVVNAVYLMAGRSYEHFADASQFAFVRDTWASLVVPHETFFIGLLVLFEAAVGVMVVVGGRSRRVALVLVAAFHVALLAFGWWYAAWSVPMVVAALLLLRAERTEVAVSPEPSSSRSADLPATARG